LDVKAEWIGGSGTRATMSAMPGSAIPASGTGGSWKWILKLTPQ